MGTFLYGPDSEVYNLHAAVSPAPGNNGSGGQIAQRGVQALGQQLILADGRKFRFAQAPTLLVVGNVIQGGAVLGTSEDLAPDADQPIGDRIVTFTHGGATTVINFFAEGYAVMSVTPGGGDCYKIASHAALTNATAGDIINLAPGNALRRAITTAATKMDLCRHPYADVIQVPVTTLTNAPCGIAISAIAAGGFGWLQTRGICGVLSDDTVVVGEEIVVGSAAAGAAGPFTDTEANSNGEVAIGQVAVAAATGKWTTVFLTIDG
ncbi:hypothetical protein LCGC14_2860500 [marine sediment metagenome]|uniref:Uncharacterized protein n=1 Tax=marine sediment metagenome TaxID=412755 RepID=A0A0F9AWW1_9ZZZZ